MKAFRVLVAVGGILLLVGLVLALGASANLSKDSNFTIPMGSAYYYQYTLSGMFTGEKVTFTYSLSSGGTVDVYLLNAAEYSAYSYDLTVISSLYANPGTASGTGSVVIPADGTYYLVVNHGSAFSGTAQSGTMSIRATGLNVVLLGTGVVLAVVGIVVLALGYRSRAKAQAAPRGYVPPSQVTMFPAAGQGLPPAPGQPPQEPPPPWGPQPPK